MRKKKERLIVTFSSTHDAMEMEERAKTKGIPGRIIPTPREISAGCGLAFMVDISDKETVETFLKKEGMVFDGLKELMF